MVSFASITPNHNYSRNDLAIIWGYKSYHAIARGVVTPKEDNKIILFVTEEKQNSAESYQDRLIGNLLHWEGPNDHFAEDRMRVASEQGDEIHLFYRAKHHSDFMYMGLAAVVAYELHTDRPSRFDLEIRID